MKQATTGDNAPGQSPETGVQRIITRPHFTMRHTLSADCEFLDHSHSSFTVTAVLSGQLQATIGAGNFDISPGQTALTNTGQFHSGRARNVEFVSIEISPVIINELVMEIGLTRTHSEITFRSSVVTDAFITDSARRVAREMADLGPGHGAMLDALARQIVIHLLRSHLTVRKSTRVELSRAGLVDRRLRRAIEFMHDNFSRELQLEEIASAAYLSEYHFARLFKQITGVTVHVYLANIRLERARKLIVETAYSINEIAAMVGYQSQSHFTKIFKSATGITPRAYRGRNEGMRDEG